MNTVRRACESQDNELCFSLDAKATVKVGEFSRGGVSRVPVKALDHDFHSEAKVTPYGILLPAHDELYISLTTGKVTSDFIVDTIQGLWSQLRGRFPEVDTLVLLQDNGPENNSHRTQFMYRMVEFAKSERINVRLAYYPPYHSKYNLIERCWAAMEHHWNGTVLDSLQTVVKYIENMRWKGAHPIVKLVTDTYESGIRLTKNFMKNVESHLTRLKGLESWFVDIRFKLDS